MVRDCTGWKERNMGGEYEEGNVSCYLEWRYPVGCNIHLTNEIIPFMHKRISICDPCIIHLKETLLSIIWNGSVMDHSESMCHQYLLSISHPRLDRIRGGTFHALRCIITDLRTKISVSFLFISGFRFESKCIN